MDERRRRQVQIAAATATALVVIVAIVLLLVPDNNKPTSLTAGTTTTSEGATSTSTTALETTTTVEPAPPSTAPNTTAGSPAASVGKRGGCAALGDPHAILFVRRGPNGPPWHVWKYDPTTCGLTQLTHDNGNPNVLNWGASWAPTRDRIAFVRKDVGVMVLSADGTEKLLFKESGYQSSGAWTSWSPDGKRIAFAGRGDGLWVIDSTTGAAKNVVADGAARSVSWSPDGSRIAFDTGGQIVTTRADGTDRRSVGPGSDADWGPDGRIAFTDSANGGGVAVMSANGKGVKKLVTDSTAGEPSWSPDGKHLVYGSNAEGVVAINADGSGKRVLVPDGSYSIQPAW